MAKHFVVAHLDTKNGKAEFVPKLGVRRNTTYVIILGRDGNEMKRLERPKTLESIATILGDDVSKGKIVAIKYPKIGKLPDNSTARISALAIELLHTSKFNSVHHTEPFKGGVTRIQSRYRKALSGNYLVVDFDLPRMIKSTGGIITANEIVIGLNRDDVDTLFTVDMEGRVIEHAQYNCQKGIELLDAVKKAIPDPSS